MEKFQIISSIIEIHYYSLVNRFDVYFMTKVNNKSVSVIDRKTQYVIASKLVTSAKDRLMVVERSPTILESGLFKEKQEYQDVLRHAIQKLNTRSFTFLYLFDKDTTRRELQSWDSKQRNFAIKTIYELKEKQELYQNRFRFDMVDERPVLPLVISDNTLVYFNGADNHIIETRVENKDLANVFFNAYANTAIQLNFEVVMGALELEYDDKDKVIIVDANDNTIGTMPRTTAHHKNLLHRGIHLEVKKGNKILICKRAAYKKIEPNKWDFSVSGHLDPNDLNSTESESYVNCVIRETKEELGITLEQKDLKPKGKFELNTTCGENVMVKLFECTIEANNFNLNEDEISEKKWVNTNQLKKMANNDELTEWYYHIITRLARKVSE